MSNFKALFPETVSFQEIPKPGDYPLFGVEQDMLNDLMPKVADLFLMGRHAAHLALQNVGSEVFEIARGEQREPVWPNGYTGSIAHTEGLAVAVAGSLDHVRGLGVDVEKSDREFRYPIQEKIASELEQKWISENNEVKRERTLALFSAKEAVFKSFFPLERVYLNFLDVEFQTQERGFKATLKKSAGMAWPVGFSFDVLQTASKGYLVSAVSLI